MVSIALATFNPTVVAVVLMAGVLRGFSGFGFSLAAVPLLSVILPLNAIVPLVLGLEAIGVLPTLGRIWRHTSWPVLGALLFGACLSMPIGLVILHQGAPAVLKPAVSMLVLGAVVLIWRPLDMDVQAGSGKGRAVVAGAISGVLNGAMAMSGPPIILYMLSSARAPEDTRATMMLFFSLSAIVALVVGLATRTYAPPQAGVFLWCLPFLAAGIEGGTLLRSRFSAERSRQFALFALAVSASASLFATVHFV